MPASEPPAIAPRLLTKAQAAAYLGLTPHGFDRWRRAGRAPNPLPGTARFDKVAIDAMIDALSGVNALRAGGAEPEAEVDPLDKWRKRIRERAAARKAAKSAKAERG